MLPIRPLPWVVPSVSGPEVDVGWVDFWAQAGAMVGTR